MDGLSKDFPLSLKVTHSDGTIERVAVHPMSIGGGQDDVVNAPELRERYGEIQKDWRGRYYLQVGEKGSMILVAPRLKPTSRLELKPGIAFRLGSLHFECSGEALPEVETVTRERRKKSRTLGSGIPFGSILPLVLVGVIGWKAREIFGTPDSRAVLPPASGQASAQSSSTAKAAEIPDSSEEDGLAMLQRMAERERGVADHPLMSERMKLLEQVGGDPVSPVAESTDEIAVLRLRAGLGDADARFRLANRYYHGEGVARDYAEAAGWYRKASDLGDGRATFALAQCLEHGIGTPRNEEEAFALYEQAAGENHPGACFRAGLMLEDGRGTETNEPLARRRYEQGVAAGSVEAMVNLGLMLAQGRGGEKDEARAFELYQKAAAQGDPDALVLLGMMHEFGIGTGRNAQLAATQYRRAAEAGDHEAKYYLELLERKQGD